ncbi:hypothetical protein A9Q73_01585 [Bermanella sp. 47_1433_sub80_T6]|nr:hypothetical protein A9Q73_01585 [Bermanella sp. 47_1433_sub80_T6]
MVDEAIASTINKKVLHMKNCKPLLRASAIGICTLLASHSIADVASGITYNNNVNCPSNEAQPDEEGVIYGTDDIDRQYLNIYKAPGDGPKPVFLYSHQNGAAACDVSDQQKQVVNGEGYTIVSWESHTLLETPDELSDAWADANLVMEYLRANAAAFNIDMNNIIVAGRSRGSAASWKLAHSGDPAVKGLYMTQALPDQVWALPEVWDPKADVTENSKPIHFSYNPPEPDIDYDQHDPRRGYDIIDVYDSLGIGDRTSIELGIPKLDLYNYFPTFLASLETSSPNVFSDDFSDGVLDPSYTIYEGTWRDHNYWQALRSKYNTSVAIIVNGETSLTDYTVSARLRTHTPQTGAKWETAGLVARMSDHNDYYEAYVKTDGVLMVKSVRNGSKTTLLNTATGVNPNEEYELSLSLQGSQIEVSVNGTSIAVINDTTHTSGQAGVKAEYCKCLFDDLVIAPL